ncbi:MAG TPA: DUF2723 domain-containing protein [Candidatus Limnocylindrales bacterium]
MAPEPDGSRAPGADGARRRHDPAPLAALIVAFGALAVYRTTLLPGLGFWDTGEAQTALPLLGTMHPTGFPAFVIVGWLFSVVTAPLGQPAFLMNLMAATCTALAAGGSVLVARRLAVPLPVAIAAGIGFALTPIVWHISNAADAHALHIALVVALTLALLRWRALVDGRAARPGDAAYWRRGDRAIVLAAAVYGVAAANHGLALILAPSIVLYVIAVEPGVLRRPRLVIAAVGTAAAVAALLYLELPLRAGLFRAPLVYAHPETLQGFWQVVLATQFLGDTSGLLYDVPGKVGWLARLVADQYGPLVTLVPLGLLVTAIRQPKYALFSGSAALITVVFAASYQNADITRYYLGPAFFAWTWLAVLAGSIVEVILRRWGVPDAAEAEDEVPSIAVPERRRAAVSLALALAFAGAMLVPTALTLNARWRAADRSADVAAHAWLDSVFGALGPNAVVVSWWSYSTPLWYGQDIEHRRPDVLIVDDSTRVWDGLGSVRDVIDRYLGTRPVYVIRLTALEINDLAGQYEILPVGQPGNLFLVTGRKGTTP